MTKKTTPKSKATVKTTKATAKTSNKKSAAAKKTTAEKKLELEAEVATETKASEAPAEKPRGEIPQQKPDPTGPGFETPLPEPKQQRRGIGGRRSSQFRFPASNSQESCFDGRPQ